MPPTYVLLAELDPLLGQGSALSGRLRLAGVDVQERTYPDQAHGFFGWLILPASERAFQLVVRATRAAMFVRRLPGRSGAAASSLVATPEWGHCPMSTQDLLAKPAPGDAPETLDAIVIGSGSAGLYMLHKARDELGLKVRAYERGTGVGGTWHWNTYPGARWDSDSYVYCCSFSEGDPGRVGSEASLPLPG